MRTATMLLAVVVVLVAAPAWADFEAGKKRNPGIETVYKLAKALKVTGAKLVE